MKRIVLETVTTAPPTPVAGQAVFYVVGAAGSPRFKAADGVERVLSGGELGYAQITANPAGITTQVDIAGLSITVTADGIRPIYLEAFLPTITVGTAGGFFRAMLYEGATLLQLADSGEAAVNGDTVGGLLVPLRLIPSAGSHTYKVAGVSTAGTGQISAGGTFPAFIRAVQL